MNQSDAIKAYLNRTGSANGKAAPEMTVSDSVELSPGAQKFSALLKAAQESLAASGAEEALRVSEIMDSINNQSYTVPTEDVVSRIMSSVIGKL